MNTKYSAEAHATASAHCDETRITRSNAEQAVHDALKALRLAIDQNVLAEAKLYEMQDGELSACWYLGREVACNRAQWSGGATNVSNIVETMVARTASSVLDTKLGRLRNASIRGAE